MELLSDAKELEEKLKDLKEQSEERIKEKKPKKELIKLLLDGIEEFRVTSGTPEGKRMMIPGKALSTYIVHGYLRFRKGERNEVLIKKVSTRINRWLKQFDAIRSGNCWVIPQKTITGLRREHTLSDFVEEGK